MTMTINQEATGHLRTQRFSASKALRFALLTSVFLSSQVGAAAALDETGSNPWWKPVHTKYSTGFDYSRGDYGQDEDTQIVYVPISVEADFFPVRAKITLPFLRTDGPVGVLPGGGGVVTGGANGLGQVVGSLGYLWVPPSKAIPFLEFTFKATAPTESAKNLGNGAWAVALQGDAFKSFGKLTAFARVGRKFYIESQSNDRLYTSIGASFRLHDRFQIGVAYDWYESSAASSPDIHQLSPFMGIKLGNTWSVGPYGLIGFSDSAPNYGMGMTLSLKR